MNRAFFLVVLLLVTSGSARAQPRSGNVDPEATLHAFIQAFDNLDWERFRAFFADDATVFYPRGIDRRAHGRVEIEANFQKVFAQIRRDRTEPPYMDLKPRDLHIQRFGEIAIATFHLDDRAGMVNRRTIVLHRVGDDWKIVHLHASEVAVPAK
jgi:ketosteroid isomerase-like protein